MDDQWPRSSALNPQPSAGVENWSLVNVVETRPGATETDVLEKPEFLIQACKR